MDRCMNHIQHTRTSYSQFYETNNLIKPEGVFSFIFKIKFSIQIFQGCLLSYKLVYKQLFSVVFFSV